MDIYKSSQFDLSFLPPNVHVLLEKKLLDEQQWQVSRERQELEKCGEPAFDLSKHWNSWRTIVVPCAVGANALVVYEVWSLVRSRRAPDTSRDDLPVGVGVNYPALLKRCETLELSVRAWNTLENAGVEFLWQLVVLSEKDLLARWRSGRKVLKELGVRLKEVGLALEMELSPQLKECLKQLTTIPI